MSAAVGMSIPEMQEAAKLGAYLEFVWVRPGSDAAKQYAPAIRQVGPEFCVLSSDLGQAANPLHPDGLLAIYQYLKAQGFSENEIDRMAKVNPAKLLGLK
jgi:predicted metal-dependent TIM-barrel fold hydrolase